MSEYIQLSSLFWELWRIAGIIGFIFLSLLIISGDTARFFDKYLGLDKIIKFQRKFSLITAIFILFHPIFFMVSTKSVIDYIIPDFTVIPFALGVITLYLFIIVMIASQVAKRISYLGWQFLHILTYVLFFTGLYHAIYWGSSISLIYFKIMYIILFIGLIIGVIYRTRYKIRKRYAGKFHVKKIKHETKDTFTLIITPEQKFIFKAWQFCFLMINKHKLYARHPFTISSDPQNPDLHFTIKETGRFTQIASKLKKGEEVIVDGPFGNFVEKKEKKNLIFIAGGVGITPFMSIIRDNIEKNKNHNILLLYGSRTKKEIIFKNELDNIKEKWFKKIYILSKEELICPLCEYGHINKEIINKYVKNLKNSIFYICGPETMKDWVTEALIDLGTKKMDIIIEDFFW